MNLGNIAGVMQMVYQTTNQTQRQAVNGSSFTDKLQEAKGVVDVNNPQETAGTGKVSLESMLKAKYPNIVYNVGDGTSSAWRTRNDYPFEAVFQEGERI